MTEITWQWLSFPLAGGVAAAGFVKGLLDVKPLKAQIVECAKEKVLHDKERLETPSGIMPMAWIRER